MLNFNKKRPVKSFVIGGRGTSLYEPTGNTHLNASGGGIVLADKQLGVFAEYGPLLMKSLKAADTTVAAPIVSIYQGTVPTNYGGPLPIRPYEKTQSINFKNSVRITKQPYTKGSLSVWSIQNITALPLTSYSVKIQFMGRHAQVIGSEQEAINLIPQFVTPNYTSGQLATAAPVSEIINNMVCEINANSFAINQGYLRQGNYPVLALAVDTTFASGVVLSTLAAGTVLPVFVDSLSTKSITLNQEQADSIKAAATAAGIALTSTVVVASRTTPVLSQAMLIVGLDRQKAFKDYEWMKKTKLNVGLNSGFAISSTTCAERTFAREEQGGAESLANAYLFTQKQRKYNLMDITDPVVDYPNIFTDMTETYNVFVIEHEEKYAVDSVNTFTGMLYDYICVETPTKGTEAVTGLFTTLETRLNTLLASANLPPVE